MTVAKPENQQPESHWDSLNCDVVVITDADCVIDTTVRPMRDSLRIKLGLPPLGKPPESELPKDNPRS